MQQMHQQSSARLLTGVADAELVRRAAAGDEVAFEAIMRRNNQRLFRTARAILANDAAAEDAVQEAYLHVWRALGTFRAQAKLSTWLVRIVANAALGQRRRRKANVIPLDAALQAAAPEMPAALVDAPFQRPEKFAMRAQMRHLMESRIDLLPEAFRAVFMLRAVEEMTTQEVATALDIPEATVRTRYFRARGLLREGLASDMDVALDEAFKFDGARCDRIVARVLVRGRAEGLARA